MKGTLLTLALAAGGNPVPHHGATAVDFYDGSFACYMGPLALRLPDSYPGLLALGKVRRISDGREQRDRGYRTIVRTIVFDGLTVIAYVFSNDPNRYLVSRVILSVTGWPQLAPPLIGQPASRVLTGHHWPAAPANGTWQMDGDDAHVTLSLTQGRIVRISYFCDMP